jgi:hypothetical protein
VSVGASRVGYVSADPVSVGLATDQRRTLDITLARSGSLEVTVKDEHGQLAAGVDVTVAPSNGDDRGDASRRSKTNSRGVVRFTGLRPASYVVTASGSGGTSIAVTSGEMVSIELIARR